MAAIKAVFLFFLVVFQFAATIPYTDINIASFNLHGFNLSSKYLKDCVHSHKGIWLVQEHWLSNHQLPRLQQLNVQYFAQSGMEDAISSGIYRGRPFGGVAICWSADLNQFVTPLTNYKHKRVTAVELKTNELSLLIISAYMPFFNSSQRERCMNDTIDAISMIELLIEDHPNHNCT